MRGVEEIRFTNDPATVSRLVEDNMKLAHYFVHKYSRTDPADALSLAMEGLLRAAASFDESRGQFGTFASIVIERRFQGYWQKLHRRAPVLGGPSLNATYGDGTGDEWGWNVADERQGPPDAEASGGEERDLITAALRHVPKMKRDILVARFVDDRRLDDIGCEFQMSRERARQLVNEALKDLRRVFAHVAEGEPLPALRDWKPSTSDGQRRGGRRRISRRMAGEQ